MTHRSGRQWPLPCRELDDAPMTIATALLLFVAGFGGGIAAAIAGGASLITFPTLLFIGLSPVVANATNFVALCLSNLSAVAADWRRRPSWGRSLTWLMGLAFAGGAVGAFLMLSTPPDFLTVMVPLLIGAATLVFALGPGIQAKLQQVKSGEVSMPRVAAPTFIASIYGGYFGIGLGVMQLAILSIGGLTDLRSTNVLKNLLITSVSASSVAIYIWGGAVNWKSALIMMAGATLGGYVGGHLIRVLPPRAVRIGIIAFGATATLIYAERVWF